MARDRATRLREFERLENQARLRRLYDMDYDDGYSSRRRTLGRNTMEAPEELVERRRYRKHVNAEALNHPGNTRSALMENVFLLILLTASIYGLYCLAIHLLNQV